MRQGQQHRRGRSRGGQNGNNNNNNNRKGQNPISRSYQSNGPDGKVSGTASSIAEKYLSLARDALSSGDPVLAENYLQHAEHYNRIILAYRESQAQTGEDANGRPRIGQPGEPDNGDDQGEDEGESYGRDLQPLPPMEPVAPRHVERQNEQPRAFDSPRTEGPRFDDRQPRFNDQQQRRPQQQRERFEPRDRYGADRFGGAAGDRNGNERHNGGERFNGNHGNRTERFQGDRYQGDRQPFAERQAREPREGGFPGHSERPYRDRESMPPRVERTEPRVERTEPRVDRAEPGEGLPPRAAMRPEVPVGDLPVARPDMMPSVDQPDLIRAEAPVRAPRQPRRERAPAPAVSEHEQPEFLRRPVRPRRREATAADEVPPVPPAAGPAPEREPGNE